MHTNKIKKQPLEGLIKKVRGYIDINDFYQAEKHLKIAFNQEPNNTRILFLSGLLEYKKCNFLKSISIFQDVLKECPSHVDAHINIGSSYSELGIFDKAEFHYQKAIELSPEDHIAFNNFGSLRRKQMHLAEAQILFDKSIEIKPDYWLSYFNMGGIFVTRKKYIKALEYFKKAFELEKNANTYASLLGVLKYIDPEEAHGLAKEIASFKNLDFSILSAYPILVRSCEWEIVDAIQDKVLKIAHEEQRQVNWVQGILLPLNNPYGISRENIFETHKAWGNNVTDQSKDIYSQYEDVMKPCSHIRIGYLSADFREHSVGYFIKNIIPLHDKAHFEVFCYSSLNQEDAITKKIISYSNSFARIQSLTDMELAKKIHDDGIHILVDLGGHTAHSRVASLKYRPAPVQITYLGYPNTTGLNAVDYRITDNYAESDDGTLYTEELLKMPESFLCFGGFIEQEIKPELPLQRKGYVTFGSFNNVSKLNTEIIKVWSDILHKVPDSKLVIKAGNVEKDYIQKNIRGEFIKHGIHEDRLELKGFNKDKGTHLDYYNEIDIALDSFPYQGTTTTCESLWMDVPVVSLVGKLHAQRVSNSIYKNIGVEDCLAYTEDEYIQIAVSLATDVKKNAKLRKKIHTRLRESILCNPERFTKQLEDLYKSAWISKFKKLPWDNFKDKHTPDDSQLPIKINGSVTVCVPDDLNLPTPYILLEQEDWIEPEYNFIQHVLKPGMKIVDIGVNYGVYTLSAAKQISSSGMLWAIEPSPERASYLRESLKYNNFNNVHIKTDLLTIDEYALENNWKNIDFLRLDVEEIDETLFTSGKEFYTSNSPLIMVRMREENRQEGNLVNYLLSLGYEGYMLIPGLNLLAPTKPNQDIDAYRKNLFFCKADCVESLSLQGLLIKEEQLSIDVPAPQVAKWIEHLQQFPYVKSLLDSWLSYMEKNNDSEQWVLHQRALDYYAMACEPDEKIANKYLYLKCAYQILAKLVQSHGTFSNVQSFVRIAGELGVRSQAVSGLEYLLSFNKFFSDPTLGEPFLSVSSDYEMIEPESRTIDWMNASIIFQYEKLYVFSSYFSDKSSLERLEKLKETGFINCEMERRRQLIRLRFNLQQKPDGSIFGDAKCNLNNWFWFQEE
ncbi:MAG: tetratricopeptide repeat protein [Gammaproteobacteria bacterium]|nr:tetratricopeptide repeat protein [Gammaproteobacteria bacterium]